MITGKIVPTHAIHPYLPEQGRVKGFEVRFGGFDGEDAQQCIRYRTVFYLSRKAAVKHLNDRILTSMGI
jgi:hypothetical protein